MCINLAPDPDRRFMIVYALDKLKCWRRAIFVHVVAKTLCVLHFIVVYGMFTNNILLIIKML